MTIFLRVVASIMMLVGIITLIAGGPAENCYGLGLFISGFPLLGLASVIYWLGRIEYRLRPSAPTIRVKGGAESDTTKTD